jgi:hypothetical protein
MYRRIAMNEELEPVELIELGTASDATKAVMSGSLDNEITQGYHPEL